MGGAAVRVPQKGEVFDAVVDSTAMRLMVTSEPETQPDGTVTFEACPEHLANWSLALPYLTGEESGHA
jgi:hypothetical protein